MQCRLCGNVSIGYIKLVCHFLEVHMGLTVTRLMDAVKIGFILREIPLCAASLDDMQRAAMSLTQIILRYRDFISHVRPASLPEQSLNGHSASSSGTNSAPLQIDQNIFGTGQNQSPVTPQSSQEEHTQSVQNCIPLVNQPNDPTEDIIRVEDSDDEEISLNSKP